MYTLDNCRTRFEDTRFECGLRLPKALRAWFECRTRFEDTRFECGLRLPKALWAWFECQTRFETYTAPPLRGSGVYLTNQEIMSHLKMSLNEKI